MEQLIGKAHSKRKGLKKTRRHLSLQLSVGGCTVKKKTPRSFSSTLFSRGTDTMIPIQQSEPQKNRELSFTLSLFTYTVKQQTRQSFCNKKELCIFVLPTYQKCQTFIHSIYVIRPLKDKEKYFTSLNQYWTLSSNCSTLFLQGCLRSTV